MLKLTRMLTGAAAAALTLTAAAPAQAQIYRDYDRRDRGIDVGDIVTGVAIAGAAAAAVGVLSSAVRGGRYGSVYERPYGTYGYPQGGYGYPQGGYGYPQGGYGYPQSGYGAYGYGEGAAVNVCASQAQRYGYGGQVRVTDVDRRSNRSYRVSGVIDQAYNQGGYGGYGGYNRYNDRLEFKCTARDDGRITDFDIDR